MRKRNSVAQLNRTASHRKAMLRNMATSLFEHERIITTRAKSKALRSYAEKLITRARHSIDADLKPEQVLHNKREIMKHIKNRDIVVKLLGDIAPRYKDRNGGYTRIIHLPERASDSSKMSVIELVDRKEKVRQARPEKEKKKPEPKKSKSTGDAPAAPEKEKGGGQEKGKWYDRFRRGKKRPD